MLTVTDTPSSERTSVCLGTSGADHLLEELEGFSVVAETRAEAEALFPVVLKEYLAAAVESGNAPAVPAARA